MVSSGGHLELNCLWKWMGCWRTLWLFPESFFKVHEGGSGALQLQTGWIIRHSCWFKYIYQMSHKPLYIHTFEEHLQSESCFSSLLLFPTRPQGWTVFLINCRLAGIETLQQPSTAFFKIFFIYFLLCVCWSQCVWSGKL